MTEQADSASPTLQRRGLGGTLKGFVLWRYERGSWQYDVMVALILIFVLLTPARYFHDQPVYGRPLSGDVVQLDQDADGTRYRVSAELLASYHDDPRRAAEEVLAVNLGHPVRIARIEPYSDPNGVVAWYDVWVPE
jgi:hypothetical protein